MKTILPIRPAIVAFALLVAGHFALLWVMP